MSASFLQLNTNKSEQLLIGSKTQLKNLSIAALNLRNCCYLSPQYEALVYFFTATSPLMPTSPP
ncbi:UNVERIFIED_CONTAM: hypothetical protein FKN15_042587 [Acipenser sinensis]